MNTKIKNYLTAGIMALVLGAAGQSTFAASITWNTPVTQTGNASDVVTTGTFFDSAVAFPTSDVSLGGVTFNGRASFAGGTMGFNNGSGIQVKNLNAVAGAFAAPGTWDANYQALVAGGAYAGSGAGAFITLSGLSVGNQYTLQIFESFWNFDWATTFSDGVNTSDPVHVGVSGTGNYPQYVTGSFLANGTTQDIFLGSSTAHVIFDAIQVRSLGVSTAPTVPENGSTVALFGSALLSLGLFARSLLSRQAKLA